MRFFGCIDVWGCKSIVVSCNKGMPSSQEDDSVSIEEMERAHLHLEIPIEPTEGENR